MKKIRKKKSVWEVLRGEREEIWSCWQVQSKLARRHFSIEDMTYMTEHKNPRWSNMTRLDCLYVGGLHVHIPIYTWSTCQTLLRIKKSVIYMHRCFHCSKLLMMVMHENSTNSIKYLYGILVIWAKAKLKNSTWNT